MSTRKSERAITSEPLNLLNTAVDASATRKREQQDYDSKWKVTIHEIEQQIATHSNLSELLHNRKSWTALHEKVKKAVMSVALWKTTGKVEKFWEKQPGFDPFEGKLKPSIVGSIAAYWWNNPFGDTRINHRLCCETSTAVASIGPPRNPELKLNEAGKHLANLQDAAYHYYRLQIKRVIDSEPLKEYEKLFNNSKIHKSQEKKYERSTRPKIKTLFARIKKVMPEANILKEIAFMVANTQREERSTLHEFALDFDQITKDMAYTKTGTKVWTKFFLSFVSRNARAIPMSEYKQLKQLVEVEKIANMKWDDLFELINEDEESFTYQYQKYDIKIFRKHSSIMTKETHSQLLKKMSDKNASLQKEISKLKKQLKKRSKKQTIATDSDEQPQPAEPTEDEEGAEPPFKKKKGKRDKKNKKNKKGQQKPPPKPKAFDKLNPGTHRGDKVCVPVGADWTFVKPWYTKEIKGWGNMCFFCRKYPRSDLILDKEGKKTTNYMKHQEKICYYKPGGDLSDIPKSDDMKAKRQKLFDAKKADPNYTGMSHQVSFASTQIAPIRVRKAETPTASKTGCLVTSVPTYEDRNLVVNHCSSITANEGLALHAKKYDIDQKEILTQSQYDEPHEFRKGRFTTRDDLAEQIKFDEAVWKDFRNEKIKDETLAREVKAYLYGEPSTKDNPPAKKGKFNSSVQSLLSPSTIQNAPLKKPSLSTKLWVETEKIAKFRRMHGDVRVFAKCLHFTHAAKPEISDNDSLQFRNGWATAHKFWDEYDERLLSLQVRKTTNMPNMATRPIISRLLIVGARLLHTLDYEARMLVAVYDYIPPADSTILLSAEANRRNVGFMTDSKAKLKFIRKHIFDKFILLLDYVTESLGTQDLQYQENYYDILPTIAELPNIIMCGTMSYKSKNAAIGIPTKLTRKRFIVLKDAEYEQLKADQ